MIDLVRKRHDGDGWILFEELGEKPGFPRRRADAFALGVWASHKYEAHLYELKVAREDLKKELRDSTKMDGVGKYAHFRWLVVSDEKIIDGLVIPQAWGILTPEIRGSSTILRTVRKAPRLKPAPFDPKFAVAMIRNMRRKWIAPKDHDALKEQLDKELGKRAKSREDLDAETKIRDLERELARLRDGLKRFEEASGVSLPADAWQYGNIGRAVDLALEVQRSGEERLRRDLHTMSETAQRFEEVAKEAARAAAALRELVPSADDHAKWCRKVRWPKQSCSCGTEPMSDVERSAIRIRQTPQVGSADAESATET